MKTTDPAYLEILNSIEALKAKGLQVDKLEASSVKNNGILNSSQENRLPKEEWFIFLLNEKGDPDNRAMVFFEEERLAKLGVYFDKVRRMGYTEWHVDWSTAVKF